MPAGRRQGVSARLNRLDPLRRRRRSPQLAAAGMWRPDGRSGNLRLADWIGLLENAVDVLAWLRELGLERYEQAFRENEIAADILPKLTADDLKDIGVTIVGHRRKLLEAIAALAEPALARQEGPSAPVKALTAARRQKLIGGS